MKIGRRGFLQLFGAAVATAVVAPQVFTESPKLQEVVRWVHFPDGTKVAIADWGDYPMYSRAVIESRTPDVPTSQGLGRGKRHNQAAQLQRHQLRFDYRLRGPR